MTDSSIWPATSGPGSSSSDNNPVNLATEFSLSATGWLKAIRFWRADLAITGTVQGRLWLSTSANSGTAVAGTDVTFVLSGTGWQVANLVTPVQLSSGVRYKAACLFPSGYSATANYWSSGGGAGGITNGILTAPNYSGSAGGDTQGCYAYASSLTYPANGSPNAGNYWVDVVISDVDPTGPTAIDIGQAVQADSAGVIAPVRLADIAQAVELGTAAPVDLLRLLGIGQAQHTDEALPVTPVRLVPVGQALERDSALAVEAIGPAPPLSRGRLTSGTRTGPSITAPPRRTPMIKEG